MMGFQTKLCKPGCAALNWCDEQNNACHRDSVSLKAFMGNAVPIDSYELLFWDVP